MRPLHRHAFDSVSCLRQVGALEALLSQKETLKEQEDILPFFKQAPDLSLMALGWFPSPDFARLHLGPGQPPNVLAHEYDLNGLFIVDLIVGDHEAHKYVLVEFEDAQRDSLFTRRKPKATPEWSRRYEHAVSQLIDWLWMLHDSSRTSRFITAFGSEDAEFQGLIVMGRDQHLEETEQKRLKWRSNHIVVDSCKISCVTFDAFAAAARDRLTYAG